MNYWKHSIVALFMLLLVAIAGTFFVYVGPLAIVGTLAFANGVTAALVAEVAHALSVQRGHSCRRVLVAAVLPCRTDDRCLSSVPGIFGDDRRQTRIVCPTAQVSA